SPGHGRDRRLAGTKRALESAPPSKQPLLRDGDGALLAARPEHDTTVARREDRVVAADAGARAGAEARAALPSEDHPRLDLLPVAQLDAESLGLGGARGVRGACICV